MTPAVAIDASFLVDCIVGTDPVRSRWCAEILDSASVLVAPQILHAEFASVVRRFYLTKRLSHAQAREAVQIVLALPIQRLPFDEFAERITELFDNVSTADAWYVAIAESWDVALATTDVRLARATGPRCRFLTPP